jgi:phage minor structural protein
VKHIQVYDVNMKRVAILHNAYKIAYTKETNNLWTCSFKLPLDDPKREEVTAKRFIELWDHDKYIGKFIINPKRTIKNDSDRSITYNCEHVLGTLHSDVLFRYHQFTNYTTRDVLQALINLQEVKHWKLGTVEFTRYFHYSWENEDSLLNAIISVPKPFDESYLWTWDDTVYPFVLNLIRPDDELVDEIRYRKNLKGIEKDEDPTNLCNRIYPLGYGEGVNQLGIESVNNGIPYLEDAASIAKYGIHKRVWVDKRFEDAASLKASAQGILDKYKEPLTTVAVDAIDYELIDPYKLVKYDVAKIVRVKDEDTDTNIDLRIMKLSKSDIYGTPDDIQFELGNVREDIGMTITDLQKKQLVNETYSQGATNIDSYTFNDNCDSLYPAVIEFPFPEDMIHVNQSTLRIKTSKFRAYSKAIEAGGSVIQSSTTEDGGAYVSSSSTAAGGGTTETTEEQIFGLLQISTQEPDPYTDISIHRHQVIFTDQFDHKHMITLQPHIHNFSMNIPSHKHNFSITIPSHTHGIQYGIWEYEELPSSLTVKIDGQEVAFDGLDGEIDITNYLRKDSEGKITRDYHTIEVLPDDLARINLIVTNRFFVQSRIGGNY